MESPQMPNSAATSSATFSSLTLFECTISNATMLVDSMTNKDLVTAWKISNQLQNKIVEVLDPRMTELSQMAEEHSKCRVVPPPPPVVPTAEGDMEPASKVARYFDPECKQEPVEENAFIEYSVKKEEEEHSEDDCFILEEVNELESFMGSTSSGSEARFFGSPGGTLRPPMIAAGAGGATSNTDSRNIMRYAYKCLRGDGPHLFDFKKPFSSPENQMVAMRIAETARKLPQCQDWDESMWQSVNSYSPLSLVRAVYRNLKSESKPSYIMSKKRHNRTLSKLARRQRSLDQLLQRGPGAYTTQDIDRCRTILSRDFTSSDEEVEDGEGGEGGTSEMLRVRTLTWESDEVRRLKNLLDGIYLEKFATLKQKEVLNNYIRDGVLRSKRGPPRNAPDWTKKIYP